MSRLYDNISLLCEDRGISIGKMCNDIGISRYILSALKSGKSKSLKPTTMEKISAYFDLTPDELIHKNFNEVVIEDDLLINYIDALRTRPEVRMLFKSSATATEEQIKTVVDILDRLKKG